MLSTDKQTDKLTNATKNITSFAKEVKIYLVNRTLGQSKVSKLIKVIIMNVSLFKGLLSLKLSSSYHVRQILTLEHVDQRVGALDSRFRSLGLRSHY